MAGGLGIGSRGIVLAAKTNVVSMATDHVISEPCYNEAIYNQGSKCPSLPGFTHGFYPGKPGLGFKPYFGKVST